MPLRFNNSVSDPVKLHYFTGWPNFGDSLSSYLIEYLLGRRTVATHPYKADLLAAGSLFGDGTVLFAPAGISNTASDRPLYVWGSGFLEPKVRQGDAHPCRDLRILAVRGKETERALRELGCLSDSDYPALGDPGLFYPDLVQDCRTMRKKYDVAIVPHRYDKDAAHAVAEAFSGRGISTVLVDVMQRNPLNCVREIASARKVLSSSLHALIAADSLGIPNRRLVFAGYDDDSWRQYTISNFKFRDYYSAFGMQAREPLRSEDVQADPVGTLEGLTDADRVPPLKVEACKGDLLRALGQIAEVNGDRRIELWLEDKLGYKDEEIAEAQRGRERERQAKEEAQAYCEKLKASKAYRIERALTGFCDKMRRLITPEES